MWESLAFQSLPYDCMSIHESLKPYVNNYKINLFDWQQVNLLQSDFRIVADYFVQMRKNRNYKPKPDKLKYVQEVLEFLAIITNDHHFEEIIHKPEKERSDTMCSIFEDVIEKSRTEERELIITLNNIL